jgi:hypothetical protein
MRLPTTLFLGGVVLLATACNAKAYNILAVDMGGYWSNLADQYFGAAPGTGAPGAAGERWYTTVDAAGLATVDFMDYDVLLVQSGFTDDWVQAEAIQALSALNGRADDIQSFVHAGRGLVSWTEPFPDGSDYNWAWAPVDLTSKGIYHENSVEVVDPGHGALAHSTSQSLSDWHSSWHGYFESWDSRLHAISQTGDYGSGDPRTHRALTLAGAYNPQGCGRMVFSMQDADYHAYQGSSGAKTLIRDSLDWAALCHPVPEPSSILLLGGGMAGIALFASRKRRDAVRRPD